MAGQNRMSRTAQGLAVPAWGKGVIGKRDNVGKDMSSSGQLIIETSFDFFFKFISRFIQIGPL